MPASTAMNHDGWIELKPGVPWASPQELNRLARQQMTNLRIYAGGDHPHEAQRPEVLDVKSLNKKNTRS